MYGRTALRAGVLALWVCSAPGWVPAAHADVSRTGGVVSGCSGGCVDVWLINCKSDQTHTLGAAAKDPLPPIHPIKVTAVGFTKPRLLLNRADIQFGNANLSLYAALSRPGYEHGPSKALVMVSADAATSYYVEFFCHDDQGQNVGDPIVTLLQDF